MDPLSVVGSVAAIATALASAVTISSITETGELAEQLKSLQETLANLDAIVQNGRPTSSIIASSSQKFTLWSNTWLGVKPVESTQPEMLWGERGWQDIQSMLKEIRRTFIRLKASAEHTQDRLNRRPSLWKRSFQKDSKLEHKRAKHFSEALLVDLLELDTRIDELWVYSDLAFDSLHVLLAQKRSLPIPIETSNLIATRKGAVLLYVAAQKSRRRCHLDINLCGRPILRDEGDGPKRSSLPGHNIEKLTYRVMMDLDAQQGTMGELWVSNEFDSSLVDETIEPYIEHLLEASENTVVCLKSKIAESNFRIMGHKDTFHKRQWQSTRGSLFADKTQNLQTMLLNSRMQKLEMAIRYAESYYHLLGTPWLTGLGSIQVRQSQNHEEPEVFAWDNELTSIESLYRNDPDALSESSQLFSLGVLLAGIAMAGLEPIDYVNFADIKDPTLWASKSLTQVQMVAGVQYAKACEFCLQAHTRPTYQRPEKYVYAEESGWSMYLHDLLQEYDEQVLSRYLQYPNPC